MWSEQDGTGLAFSSSTGFKLSTGAERSPDASWMKLEGWNALSPEQKQRFAPICPEFVVELSSPSDNLKPLQEKMQEYMREPGIQLGWLIDLLHRGELVLPGFILNMSKVW